MLPVKLPQNINLNVKGNPLDHQNTWKEIEIDEKLIRETDTLIHLFAHLGIFWILLTK